jgi:hypothetical protein
MTSKAVSKPREKRNGSSQPPAWRWITMQLMTLIRQFGNTVIWASVVIYLIHATADTVKAFAGRTSVANFVVALAAHLNATVVGSVTLTGVTSCLWALEYRRHRKTRERLTGRITDMELRLDHNRTSSQLTTEGTTRIGDL